MYLNKNIKVKEGKFDGCNEKEMKEQYSKEKKEFDYYRKQDRSMSDFGDQEYIKIPINIEGQNGWVEKEKLIKLLYNSKKIFYITPKIEGGIQKNISHTSSYNNAHGLHMDNFSASHCQYGTNILIYNIELCDGINCVISDL